MKQVNKLLVGCCLMMAGFAAQAAELQVQLEGVKHDKGVVKVGLYRDAATFRKENQAFQTLQAPAKAGTVTIKFANIPTGQYAIMAYHDEDGNGEMNRRLGMFPTEGYALSNNPKVMGPPAFADSAFKVDTPRQQIIIQFRY